MPSLSKKERDALPSDQFAVPGKRKLLINDERHTKLAWDNVDKTQGLTDAERIEARQKILAKAQELEIDTATWESVRMLSMEAMSLNISNDDNHPNKIPFKGVLTKLDEPSDSPPGGAMGKRIIVTKEAARAALSSLLMMAVNFTPTFDGHDVRAKIGVITSADIVGNELQISGFIYAADFPEEADLIQELKDVLGFSFEAHRLQVEDMSASILRITEMTFTGAAILLKSKAAYQTTSLAASAEGILNMTPEELKALFGPILAEALKPLSERIEQVAHDVANPHAALIAKVEPHCVAMEASAKSLEEIGAKDQAKSLRDMAESIRANAKMGKEPASLGVNTTSNTHQEVDLNKQEVEALIASAVKPISDKNTELETQLKAANDKLAAAETTITDLKAGKRRDTQAPDRKTLDASVLASMSRANIKMPEGDEKLVLAEVDKALQASGLDLTRRIAVKTQLNRIGVLA